MDMGLSVQDQPSVAVNPKCNCENISGYAEKQCYATSKTALHTRFQAQQKPEAGL